MRDNSTLTFRGKSGRVYGYWVYKLRENFGSAPCNYCYARKEHDGDFTPLYFGETKDSSGRFPSQYAEQCINGYSATHLLAHLSSDSLDEREAELRDLIGFYEPPVNGG